MHLVVEAMYIRFVDMKCPVLFGIAVGGSGLNFLLVRVMSGGGKMQATLYIMYYLYTYFVPALGSFSLDFKLT